MSFSKPQYFSTTAPAHYRPNVPEYDTTEHWSKTLERRPVGRKYGKGYAPSSIEVDFDNRTDNYDREETDVIQPTN